MELRDAILTRRSTRAFTGEQITDEQLGIILEAAHMAPIAGAGYTMTHLTVVQDASLLSEIREARGLRRRSDGVLIDPLYNAPTLVVLSVTGPSDDSIEYCNVACAIENMALAATSLGLGSCYLWGYLKKLRRHPGLVAKLCLPHGYTPLSSIGVGYAAESLLQREPKANLGVNYVR